MRTRLATLTLLLSTPVLCDAQTASRADVERAIAAVYPSLVRISVVSASYASGREVRSEASGSGTIISPEGFVITNHHVAGHARRIVCTLATQEEVPADLVGTDPLTDITVLKLRPSAPRSFPVAKFAAAARLSRGDTVLALGSPLALSQSVTLGIVSNPEMVMPRAMSGGVSLDGEDVGSIVRWIGHDAAIFPGNSGGPLVNLLGEIVGVNELSFGLAAAIPADVVKPVAEALIAHGRVRRGWLGVELQPRLNQQTQPGALVAWVEEGSPAAAAGIESGDLLVRVDATPLDVKFPEQLPLANQAIASLTPGRAVALELVRGGASKRLSITPRERTAAAAVRTEIREWGVVAAGLTETSARDLGRASTGGVRVVSIRSGGAAQQAKPPIEPDDVIVEVDGKPLKAVADLRALTDAAMVAAERASLLVTFERGRERRLTIVELTRGQTDDPILEARKAWLAIGFQVLTLPLAQRLGLPGRTGVRVTRVIDPAVPLRVGDIILAVDGTPVRATAPGDEQVFTAALRQYGVNASVALTVHRDGAEVPITVRVRPAPRQAREMRRYEDAAMGFRARDISEVDLDEPRLSGVTEGAIVDAVEPGGWAALARLGTGDVITEVGGQRIKDVDALANVMKAAAAARPASLVLRVRRGVRTAFIEIEPAWPK